MRGEVAWDTAIFRYQGQLNYREGEDSWVGNWWA